MYVSSLLIGEHAHYAQFWHSTFAAEARAAVETFGLAKYYRAYLCDILSGYADWRKA